MFGSIISEVSELFKKKDESCVIDYKSQYEHAIMSLEFERKIARKLEENAIEMWKNNKQVISIECIEVRQCYDSRWKVSLFLNEQVVCATIVRRDCESLKRMFDLVNNVKDFSELKDLDCRDTIYYD